MGGKQSNQSGCVCDWNILIFQFIMKIHESGELTMTYLHYTYSPSPLNGSRLNEECFRRKNKFQMRFTRRSTSTTLTLLPLRTVSHASSLSENYWNVVLSLHTRHIFWLNSVHSHEMRTIYRMTMMIAVSLPSFLSILSH